MMQLEDKFFLTVSLTGVRLAVPNSYIDSEGSAKVHSGVYLVKARNPSFIHKWHTPQGASLVCCSESAEPRLGNVFVCGDYFGLHAPSLVSNCSRRSFSARLSSFISDLLKASIQPKHSSGNVTANK